MNILRLDVSIINKFLDNFKELFSNKQFNCLKMFVYASLKDYKRLNLSALCKELSCNYQALQYFFSDAKWDYHSLNDKRIKTLRKQRTTGFTKEGVLAIDDTGSVKPYAKKTEGAAYQYCPSLRGQGYCNIAVASCYVNPSKHIPLNFKFYKVQDEFRLGKYDEAFRSKIDFARELFTEAVNKDIPFSYVVFDSWYSASELLEYIHKNKRMFINEIKSDRRFSFKHPVTRKTLWLKQDELVKLIKKHFWDKTKVVRYGDKLVPVYPVRERSSLTGFTLLRLS